FHFPCTHCSEFLQHFPSGHRGVTVCESLEEGKGATMDAKTWRTCKVAKKLVDESKGNLGERPMRLLARALARMRWHKMEPGTRAQVLELERYLDGMSGAKKPAGRRPRGSAERPGAGILGWACKLRDAHESASMALASLRIKKDMSLPLVRCLFGNPFVPL